MLLKISKYFLQFEHKCFMIKLWHQRNCRIVYAQLLKYWRCFSLLGGEVSAQEEFSGGNYCGHREKQHVLPDRVIEKVFSLLQKTYEHLHKDKNIPHERNALVLHFREKLKDPYFDLCTPKESKVLEAMTIPVSVKLLETIYRRGGSIGGSTICSY